jgi:DNA-binding transcriptional regulator YiaG
MAEAPFRNVDAAPKDPIESWPLEAIQAALERGNLKHWRRLAAAIKAAPWGPVARDVEEVLTYSRPYGVAKTMERVIEQARSDTETAERAAVATEIQRLIEESGLSPRAFASHIGTSTSRLSTYATGKVVPSAALLVRMRSVAEAESGSVHAANGFVSLAGSWRGRVKIGDDFD